MKELEALRRQGYWIFRYTGSTDTSYYLHKFEDQPLQHKDRFFRNLKKMVK